MRSPYRPLLWPSLPLNQWIGTPCGHILSAPGSNSEAPRIFGSAKNQWP